MDRNDRAITGFTMIGHAAFHTYELVIPLFVVVWLREFGATPATLGLVVAVGYALVGVGALPAGALADRIGSKRLVVGCLVGMGLGFLVVSAARSLLALALGLLVWGAAASIYHPAGLTLLSRGTRDRGTAFAYHGAAGNVGVATGPLLGAVLLAFLGWRSVAGLLVVPLAVAIAVALRLDFDETTGVAEREGSEDASAPSDGDQRAARPGRDASDGGPPSAAARFLTETRRLFAGGFGLVFLVGILYGLYYRGAFTFLPEILASIPSLGPVAWFGRTLAPSQYVYSGLLLLGGLGQYAGGRLVDRIPAEHALVGSHLLLAALAVGFLPAADAGLVPLLLVSGLLGFAVFMEAPINQEVISRHVPADVRGLSFGYTYVAVFGVGAAGSWMAGAVLTRATPGALFGLLAGVAVVAALLVGLLVLRYGRGTG